MNIVSVSGVVASPPSGPYSASKHAQLAFSRTAAAELRRERIRVHTVKPGFVETEGFRSRGSRDACNGWSIRPEDVAAHVLRSLEEGRGETTVPWFYGPIARSRMRCRISSHASLVGRRKLPRLAYMVEQGQEPTIADVIAVAEFRSALRHFLRRSEKIARESGLTPQRYTLLMMIKGAPGVASNPP